MQTIGISLALAAFVGVVVLGVAVLSQAPDRDALRTVVDDELGRLEDDLVRVSEGLADLETRMAQLESAPAPVETGGAAPAESVAGEPAPGGPAAADETTSQAPEILKPFAGEMREYVFSLIGEERELRQNERREIAAERQREMEELKKGPYENYNLKINSLAKVLGLDGRQADRYYEVSKVYNGEFQDLHKKVKWNDKESTENYMKETQRLQKEFDAEVDGLLTAEQADLYGRLPQWARSPQNMGYVTLPGERSGNAITIQGLNVGGGVFEFRSSDSAGSDGGE